MIPIAESLTESGPRNRHSDFPEPVAMRTNTSRPWVAARVAASWNSDELLVFLLL